MATIRKRRSLTRVTTGERLFRQDGFHPRGSVFMLEQSGRLSSPFDHETHILTVPLVTNAPSETAILALFVQAEQEHDVDLTIWAYCRAEDGAVGYVGFPSNTTTFAACIPDESARMMDMLTQRLGFARPAQSMFLPRSRLIEELVREKYNSLTDSCKRTSDTVNPSEAASDTACEDSDL
jgi:hypothetical protein